jgi:Flp pilus assembly pilin Flp
MELIKLVKTFKNDESGAVTVDWVVLTAAIVGLGIAVMTAISSQIGSVTDSINADLSAAPGAADTIGTNAAGSSSSSSSTTTGG